MKRVLSLLLSLLMLIGSLSAEQVLSTANTNGYTRDSAAAYMLNTILGRGWNVDGGGVGFDCKDLALKYFEDIGGLHTYELGHALIYANSARLPDGWTRQYYSNGYNPEKGDMACWGAELGGGYGHVALIYDVDSTYIYVIEQSSNKNVAAYKTSYRKTSPKCYVVPDFVSITPEIGDNKNYVKVNEDIVFYYNGLSECSKVNFFFEKNGTQYYSVDSTHSREFKTYFENEGLYYVYVGGLYGGQWYYSGKIKVYVFNPKLTVNKTAVSTGENIIFTYSGLSEAGKVELCFEKNGKTYYSADVTKSRTHINYFENEGEYYVYAKGSISNYSINSDKVKITVANSSNSCSHNYQGTVTTKPTCTNNGEETFTCSKCGDKYTQEIPATEHQPVVIPAVSPSCTQTGLTEGSKCSECGIMLLEQNEVPALGHDYVGNTQNEATCQEEGLVKYICSVCGDHYTDTIPKSDHQYETSILQEATCSQTGLIENTCLVCGDSHTQIVSRKEHNITTQIVPATCNQSGYTIYICEDCSYSYCSDYVPMQTHAFVDTVMEPTTESQGYTVHTCKDCGFSYVDSITDILPSQMHYLIPSLKDINTTLTVKSRENEYMVTASTGVFALDSIKGDIYRVYASQKNSLTVCVGEYDTKLGEVINNEEVFIPLGDVNGDDVINIADVSVLLSMENYGQTNSELDLTGDNSINIADIAVTLQETNYGKTSVAVV